MIYQFILETDDPSTDEALEEITNHWFRPFDSGIIHVRVDNGIVILEAINGSWKVTGRSPIEGSSISANLRCLRGGETLEVPVTQNSLQGIISRLGMAGKFKTKTTPQGTILVTRKVSANDHL